jgi:hypothetical protein
MKLYVGKPLDTDFLGVNVLLISQLNQLFLKIAEVVE